MTHPVSRTILLLDIEKFSHRDDVEQIYLRRMLYDITDRVLEAAGVDAAKRQRADRGDSVMDLIDANASVVDILRSLLINTPAELRTVNRMASRSAQIRLRTVLAQGYVDIDEHGGWVGTALNHACRLLDADLLRKSLAERDDDFALVVSAAVYEGVVQHGHTGLRPEDFSPVAVDSKNGSLPAWLHGPVPGTDQAGGSGPAASAPSAPSPSAVEPTNPSAPNHPGSGCSGFVAGDQYGVNGGQNFGDLNFDFRGGSR